ncbi:phage tail assembly chaperone [Rhodopseudomonas sp. RCAM05734]|uniref:phage tail assembly chaperone n=1 Tax=Rhodopseudomonas sp. RCAM05734 TaxID=3457549 RepID=UPI0040446170
MFAQLGLKPKPIATLDPLPEFPWAVSHVWDWFHEFSIGLKANGMAPVMAGWDDVQHWSQAMRLDLEPWEKRLLVRLANLRASVQAETEAAKAKDKK